MPEELGEITGARLFVRERVHGPPEKVLRLQCEHGPERDITVNDKLVPLMRRMADGIESSPPAERVLTGSSPKEGAFGDWEAGP